MSATATGTSPLPLRATADGRRLRLEVPGSDQAFLVDPLPAKCGLALTSALLARPDDGATTILRDAVFAEAFGPQNFAVLTGNHVQEFDPDGRYVRTSMPGAVMVEPQEDVPPPEPGQRIRVIDSACDGLPVRLEDLNALALAAVLWQSAGTAAVSMLLNGELGLEAGKAAAAHLVRSPFDLPATSRPAGSPGAARG